jgi:hypothetical protein
VNPEEENLKPLLTADETQLQAMLGSIINISCDIPEEMAKLAANIIAGAGLLDAVHISRAEVLDQRTTQTQALIIPLPDISRFALPEPFKGQHGSSWALIHGTSALGAQCILLEGLIRPADWVYNQDPRRRDLPHLGHSSWDLKLAGPINSLSDLSGQLEICWTEPLKREKDNYRC